MRMAMKSKAVKKVKGNSWGTRMMVVGIMLMQILDWERLVICRLMSEMGEEGSNKIRC